jgi:RNA polymerase sigma-70 factor (ECF subfamily)
MDEVARAFREAHGPAVATLAGVLGDLTLAEDAVPEAFVAALRRWPQQGIPSNPAGWIVIAARNPAVDQVRRAAPGPLAVRQAAAIASTRAEERLEDAKIIRDDQMRLIFTCCHPSLLVAHQVAVTLRLIAGLRGGR